MRSCADLGTGGTSSQLGSCEHVKAKSRPGRSSPAARPPWISWQAGCTQLSSPNRGSFLLSDGCNAEEEEKDRVIPAKVEMDGRAVQLSAEDPSHRGQASPRIEASSGTPLASFGSSEVDGQRKAGRENMSFWREANGERG
jgi:hypothetical protein